MKQQYILTNTNSFNPKHIFECGQCFRWNEQPDGSYTGVFGNNVLNVKQENNQIIFSGICDGNIEEICKDYFDLDTDYAQIKNELSKIDDNLKQGIQYGDGIRILKQDLWETIISFIISANNNIPRIKKIIEKRIGNRNNEIDVIVYNGIRMRTEKRLRIEIIRGRKFYKIIIGNFL